MNMNKDLKGKKLLILAGADVHTKVVNAARELGVYTIVTDYLKPEDSPAKLQADEYWMLNITAVDEIVKRSKEERINGILAFCIDPAQLPYYQVCKQLNLPCYGTKKQFDILTNKRLFKQYCIEHGVEVIPEYSLNQVLSDEVHYPVLVKPSESRGSRGQTVCYEKQQVMGALKVAEEESKDGMALIERYMEGAQDMSFAYSVISGEPYLIKIGDRFLGAKKDNLDRQHMATILPSVHVEDYKRNIEPNVVKMIRSLGIEFGAVFLQGFWEKGHVYMYDPGLRFPGSDYDLVLKKTTGYDNMSTFVQFALTGNKASCFGNPNNACYLNGRMCLILSISVRPGVISVFQGFEEIASLPCVMSSSKRFHEGDEIFSTGDVRQRVAEFVVDLPNRESIRDFVDMVYTKLKVLDANGEDMIISKINFKENQ